MSTQPVNEQLLIERDPEKLGGTPVFYGTRVPIKNTYDYLEGNYTLEEFPTVERKQVAGVLKLSRKQLTD